jgi:hypothetical protein
MNSTCQICERTIKAKTGVIAHHGYQRPGDGWQTASCFGARNLPYEVSCDRIQPYIDMVTNYRTGRENYIQSLVDFPPDEVTIYLFSGEKNPRIFPRPADFKSNEDHSYRNRYSSYEGEWQHRISEAKREIEKATREIERMENRLAAWKSQNEK